MSSLPWPFERPPLIVAAVTPLADDGERLDEEAIWPLSAFFAEHGADGVFACGTTGEGILLSLEERRRVAVAYRAAVRGRLIVHAGAQSTRDTAALAAHAAEIGADGVAVIPPPYFALDPDALTAHFTAAAQACAPLPFFIYAFAARSGYPVPVEVVQRVQSLRPEPGGPEGQRVPARPRAAVPGAGSAGAGRVGAADSARHGAGSDRLPCPAWPPPSRISSVERLINPTTAPRRG